LRIFIVKRKCVVSFLSASIENAGGARAPPAFQTAAQPF